MSRKVQQFANIITQPLNTYNFHVNIPEANFSMIVESTQFPSEQLREVVLYYKGEEIRYPAIPQNSHQWSFNIVENDSGAIRRQFDALKSSRYNQSTGLLVARPWRDVQIFARDMADNPVFSCILHGAWCKGRGDGPSLNANSVTDSWKWTYQFVFQWIEDVDHNNQGMPNPFV